MSDHHDHHHEDGREDAALLNYMVNHNAHHADELRALSSHLKEEGEKAAAEAIEEALASFDQGNESLRKALSLLPNE